jgi:hypothetical protein
MPPPPGDTADRDEIEAIDETLALFPPDGPLSPRTPAALDDLDDLVGLRLPTDYRRLVTTRGPGRFDEWVSVYWVDPTDESPASMRYGLGIDGDPELGALVAGSYAEAGWHLHQLVVPAAPPPPPGADLLLPWGRMAGAEHTLFWRVRDRVCVSTVAVYMNAPEQAREWPLGLVPFLRHLLVEHPGDLGVPADVRAAPHRFTPAPAAG